MINGVLDGWSVRMLCTLIPNLVIFIASLCSFQFITIISLDFESLQRSNHGLIEVNCSIQYLRALD